VAVKTSNLPFLRQYDKVRSPLFRLIVLVISLFSFETMRERRAKGARRIFIRELDISKNVLGAVHGDGHFV
jgi:hypothetical protein